MSKKGTRGIIYLMESAIPGLIKIGRCGTKQYKERMRDLSSNGYRNATKLECVFAIEVDNHEGKENLLHSLFKKYQVGKTELFAVDVNMAIALLSAFDGDILFSKYSDSKSKDEVFEDAAGIYDARCIPDGEYKFLRKKRSENNKEVKATAVIKNHSWTIKAGSVLGMQMDTGVSDKVVREREKMRIDSSGTLLEDHKLGECYPSFAASLVMFGSSNGWTDWKDKKKNKIDIYRPKGTEE